MFPWEGDTESYAGTYSNVRASYQSPRRARGKHRGNAVRKPSWIPNETLEVLKSTRVRTNKLRTTSTRTIAEPRHRITAADLAPIGNVE